MATKEATRRSRGRPRLFDPDEVLDAAMTVFWQHGYEGTSLTALTTATGLSRPSLYAAFGDKESIYRHVLDRYISGPSSYLRNALSAPTAYEAVSQLLHGAINLLTSPGNPSICMIAQGTLACGEESETARNQAIERRRLGQSLLRERLARAVSEGELPVESNPAELALYFATVMRGIGISVLTGATRDELLVTARLALSVFPGN